MTIDVLIVEDDKDINELMKLSLTTKGIKQIKVAYDIDHAKTLLHDFNFQVVLLDLNLR